MRNIQVICGPMFSGKTEELIRVLRRAEIAKQEVVVFKPAIDKRYSETDVVSHSGMSHKSFSVVSIDQIKRILEYSNTAYSVIGIEETQFFEKEEIKDLINFFENGMIPPVKIVTAGLDMDYKGEPFEAMSHLMGIATSIKKLDAVCTVCGESGTHTYKKERQNKINDRVEVGGSELYEARCYDHWRVV